MSEAALTEDTELSNDPGQEQEQESIDVEQTESATVADEAPKEDGFQKRINKVTADKYAEQRRADTAEAELAKLRVATPATVSKAPTLEEFDHDEEAFNRASIKHQVAEAVKAERQVFQTEENQATAVKASQAYDQLVSESGKDDFFEVAAKIPVLDQGLVSELMSTKEGVEMIYHLGTHLDVADKISNMNPYQAMAELTRISVNMSAKPEQKLSAAPDPIEPLNSGGSISTQRGPQGAKFE